jgi:anti-sigma factor RsiW
MDVRSTDQHTVKPWFTGKIDFAPRVYDLADKGFPLIGGRVDYINGHSAAALVYGRRRHVVNLFIWPASASDAAEMSQRYNGYSMKHWVADGFSYWAVSDAAPAELDAFRQAYESAT